jgi:flagellar basal-body rod protein FlgC
MDIDKALAISAAGMQVQTTRLRVIAENLANQDSTATGPNGTPYRRKVVTFENRLDAALGTETVRIGRVGTDPAELPKRYDPSHPAADAQGYVQTPNVNPFVETMDMRAAERSYSANLNVMQASRNMLSRTIDLLK